MLVHSYTGALDIVSEELVSYLRKTKEFDKESFPFSDNTFDRLAKRGHITQMSMEEEKNHVRNLAFLLHKDARNSKYGFMFVVSYDCNFRCAYCYEGGISHQGNKWSKKTFTKEMVDRAYKAMLELAADKNKHLKRIILYGGEPFLKENIGIVKYIVSEGVSRGYEFEAISNGHDLESYKPLMESGAIKSLQITFDGTQKTHNERRYHYETGDSFDAIFRNVGLALSCGIEVTVRFNMDENNFPEAIDLQKMFDEVGYSKYPNFYFYTAMLRNAENCVDEESSLIESIQLENNEDGADFSYLSREEFATLTQSADLETNHKDYYLYKTLTSAIINGTYVKLNSIGCGSQANFYIFDPLGDIYCCWESVGIKSHIIGNYSSGTELFEESYRWKSRNIANTVNCDVCKYALFCGGGCMSKALRFGSNFKRYYCGDYHNTFRQTVNAVFDKWLANNNT